MFFLNPTLILLTIISLIYCFYKKLFLNELIIFLLFFLTFITLLHFTVNSEHRYLMPTIPALAIISSVGLNEVLKNKKFIFQLPIIIFLFSYPLITSFTNYLLSQNDTRTQALIWLNQNAEKKVKLLMV